MGKTLYGQYLDAFYNIGVNLPNVLLVGYKFMWSILFNPSFSPPSAWS